MPRLIIDTDELYSTDEATQLIGIGYATLYRWIKSGKLIALKLNHRTLIPQSEIKRLQQAREGSANKA
ncbi:MAG: helix-turn-helix domain-containing protein [Chloroflexi bacterium]|nr:helix-turn-helix domain-containing protein [Chloroflexota bacterium]